VFLSIVGLLLLPVAVWIIVSVGWSSRPSADPSATTAELRQSLLKLRMARLGTLEARVAVDEFMKLPSPLDRLDPKSIPADGRLAGDPKELAAVLGIPGQKRVQSVAFSPDGKLLACGDSDNLVRLWATVSGQEWKTLQGHPAAVFALAFSPDGLTLASGGGDVRLWEVASGKELTVLKPAGDLRPSCLAYAPDGQTLAVAYAGAGVLKLWDVPPGRERVSLPGLSDLIFTLGFSADGRTVAVTSYQRPVKVWNVADGAERPAIPLDNAYCVAYAADNQTAVVVSEGKMKLWDVATNRERSIVPVTTRYDRLALSLDGSKAATTTSGGSIAVWGLPAGNKLHEWRLPNAAPVQYHFTYVPAFAPDGRHLAVAGDNGKVYVFRLAPPAAGK
jgi:WD40 repeat protein